MNIKWSLAYNRPRMEIAIDLGYYSPVSDKKWKSNLSYLASEYKGCFNK